MKKAKDRYIGFPFNPSRFPVFYGWIILVVGTLGVIMSIPGQTMGVSVFTDFLIDALSLSRDQLSFAYLLGTISSALLITKAGKLYDKFGSRIVGLVTAIMLSVSLLFMTGIDSYAIIISNNFSFLSKPSISFVLVVIGFFLIRFFGQGVMTMTSRSMVMKWFDKTRGFISGVMGVFVAFGFSYAPKLFNDFIDLHGWRGAWWLLAAIVGPGFGLIAFFFHRDNPEQCGLKADGNFKLNARKKRPPSLPKHDYTLKQAKKTYSFWIFNLTLSMFSLFITAFTFHIVSLFETAGMNREQAVSIFLPASFIAVGFQFLASWLSDYMKLKYLLIAEAVGLGILMSGVVYLGKAELMIPIIIFGHGIASAIYRVLMSVTWPRFFGLSHLGAISGYSMSWMVAGSAIGPYLFSLSFSRFGTYAVAALFCIIITAILLILAIKADNVNSNS